MNWLHNFFLPPQASSLASSIDNLFWFVSFLNIVFFVLVSGLAVFFVVRYKRRREDEVTPHITHNLKLEIFWTTVPLVIVIALFFLGFHGYMLASIPPSEAIEISVTGKQWLWEFEYPDGMRTVNELHVPLNKNIRLIMHSEDVIHSFYVPAFRIKQDVLPGRFTQLWFKGTIPGTYQLFCAEYCGKGHSDMLGKVSVDDDVHYQDWLKNGDESLRKMPLVDLGKLIYETRGCATCHSITGERGQGPSWKGIWGQTHQFNDGGSETVDINYVRESVLTPQKHIVKGFEGIMPTYEGLLRDREIEGVAAYIQSLK